MFSTIEDIYVANIDTDRGQKEKVRFIDTAGIVSTSLFFTIVFRCPAVRTKSRFILNIHIVSHLPGSGKARSSKTLFRNSRGKSLSFIQNKSLCTHAAICQGISSKINIAL